MFRRRRVAPACLSGVLLLLVAACQPPARQTSTREAPPPSSAPAAQPDESPPKRSQGDNPPAPTQQRQVPPPDNQPSEQSESPRPPPPKDDSQEARRLAEIARLLAEAKPKRPTTPPWVICREAFDETADAACAADWTGGNRLEVHTENIKRLTLDLNRLPSGAPGRGPWNLQLDGQGIQVTGFHGKVLDLVRSKAGNWTVDRKKFKK